MYHIGVSKSEREQIHQIIARLDAQSPGPDADRRIHPRIDFSHPMWLNLPTAHGKPWVHIFSRNLSTRGLAFLTRQLFHVGQALIISHQLNEPCPHLVLCKVCFCRSVTLGIMEVGLTFDISIPDPANLREIPEEWSSAVLRSDWLARRKIVG